MSPSPPSSSTLLLAQLRDLEAQLPPPGRAVALADSTKNVASANRILTNTRLIREELAADSAEASRRLSDAFLDIVMYTEKLETTTRLLTLADSCIGQIRSRMRALGVPIYQPSGPSDTITASDASGPPASDGPMEST